MNFQRSSTESSLWENFKEKTAANFQNFKERIGTSQPFILDEEFDEQCKNLDLLEERLKQFYLDMDNILKIIANISQSGQIFASALQEANDQSKGKLANISNCFEAFYNTIIQVIENDLIKNTNQDIRTYFEGFRETFKELEQLKEKRNKAKFLFDHYQEKIAVYEKLKFPKKVEHFQEKLALKRPEYDQLAKEFKVKMSSLWTRRYELIEKPLEMFVSFAFQFCFHSFNGLHDLQKGATPEQLMQNFDIPIE